MASSRDISVFERLHIYERLETGDNETEIVNPNEDHAHKLSGEVKILWIFGYCVMFCITPFMLLAIACDYGFLLNCESKKPFIPWDKTMYDTELKGGIHFVGGFIVCLFQGGFWGNITPSFSYPGAGGGVLGVGKKGGLPFWATNFKATPIHIDCGLIGNSRCLVLGDQGYLMAIHTSGNALWKMISDDKNLWPQPEDIDFPLPLYNVGELVTLSRFKAGGHRLVFVSMQTGKITREPLLDSDCHQVSNLSYFAYESALHYSCSSKLGIVRIMKFKLLNERILQGDLLWDPPVSPCRHNKPDPDPDINATHDERQIVVTNTGSCPFCNTTIVVTDSKNRTVWSYRAIRTYTLAPLTLRFKLITGFLIKLWQWHEQKLSNNLGSSKRFSVQLISERIVLITFNQAGSMHVVNASETDIIQLCDNRNKCQPQLSFQTQSALLADVNGDGQKDLISYFVTHEKDEDSKSPEYIEGWRLLSNLRIVSLEAELPKLYDAVYKQ